MRLRNEKLATLTTLAILAGRGMAPAEEASMVQTALSSTVLSGYVDTSAQWNIGTGNAGVPAYSFSQGKADGFNLNVVKLSLERLLDETEWAAGYKVDLLFGPDARFLSTTSSGLDTADVAIKQAYVVLRAPVGNGLDFKVGVWDTLIGYELFESPYNAHHTRSYGYTIEPTTHTGVLASYQVSPLLSVNVGIANTFGPDINDRAFPQRAESFKTYLGSFTLTAPEDLGFLAGSTLTAGVVNGFNASTPDDARGFIGGDQTSWYIGGSFNTPITGLKVGASYDYLGISDQAIRGSTYANAAALYASLQVTEKLSVHGRGEYASSGSSLFLGAEEITAFTGTLQYDLWKNVLSRLEFRWDHALDGSEPFGGKDNAGGKKNSFIILANVAYKF